MNVRRGLLDESSCILLSRGIIAGLVCNISASCSMSRIYFCWLRKPPLLEVAISIPKKYSTFSRSLMENCCHRLVFNFTTEVSLLLVIIKSFTYTSTISLSAKFYWINNEELTLLLVKPSVFKATFNLACHARGLCFNPYMDLWSLQTRLGEWLCGCPGGSFMNTFSSSSPCKNALHTSIWYNDQPRLTAIDNKTRTIVIFATGAKVSL